jgi:hypothetical protein
MSATQNEIWLTADGYRVRLDLDDETQLLVSYQANDRTKTDTIQSDFSAEFSAPGTAHNQRLLKHAAASQPVVGSAYVRVPCVLTSGGVETLPKALLYIKGYKEGRYQLQIFAGNKRFVEQLGDKKLADLDLNRFNHYWTPDEVLARLPYDFWKQNGYGYEVYDRGKPLDLQALDPYSLYPACSGELVFQQIIADAGFTADSLLAEPLAQQLTVPTANPYEYSQDYRDARQLTAGYAYDSTLADTEYHHRSAFGEEKLVFPFTERKPYHLPDPAGATYFAGAYTADTLGFYNIQASVPTFLGINKNSIGSIRCKFQLKVNGLVQFDGFGSDGHDEIETDETVTHTFTPKLTHYFLKPGDKVELFWNGDELGPAPSGTHWNIGPYGAQVPLKNGLALAADLKFTCDLLADFPPGGLVRLQDWLPDVKQLDYVKAYMGLFGLTIQTDPYNDHLRLAPGSKLLTNVPRAKNWSAKRSSYALPGRLPERELAFRFGSFGQKNYLKWTEDDNVKPGYGDGTITVADEVLESEYDMAKLPFAATEASPDVPGLLRILNFEAQDLAASPITYSTIEAKPRLTLRSADNQLDCQLITTPQHGKPGDGDYTPAVLTAVSTTAAYFAGVDVSLLLDSTVLTTYWADLRAMLDGARYLTEYYRLTPQDVAELNFSVPIWDSQLGDYFAVSVVGEYDARRPVEVKLARLNAAHLGPPAVPGDGVEFYGGEFYTGEFY